MSVPAPTNSALMSRLRTSFATQGSVQVSDQVVADEPVVTDQIDTAPMAADLPSDIAVPDVSTRDLSVEAKLDLFDQVLTQVEAEAAQAIAAPAVEPAPVAEVATVPVEPPQVSQTEPVDLSSVPAAVPTAVQTLPDPLNPAVPVGSTAKESFDVRTVDQGQVEMPAGVQSVEQEIQAELSPEVEAYIEHVEDHHQQQPQEIVFADGTEPVATQQYVAQPVVVLPITTDIENQGARKSSAFSIRWLVEWSRKVMKMFSGKVIYRQLE